MFLVNDGRYFRHLGKRLVSDVIVEYDAEKDLLTSLLARVYG